MSALMTVLTVRKPNGMPSETFRDFRLVRLETALSTSSSLKILESVCVYSYVAGADNCLKIYEHTAPCDADGVYTSRASDGAEIAHFRPGQWETVRSGGS